MGRFSNRFAKPALFLFVFIFQSCFCFVNSVAVFCEVGIDKLIFELGVTTYNPLFDFFVAFYHTFFNFFLTAGYCFGDVFICLYNF